MDIIESKSVIENITTDFPHLLPFEVGSKYLYQRSLGDIVYCILLQVEQNHVTFLYYKDPEFKKYWNATAAGSMFKNSWEDMSSIMNGFIIMPTSINQYNINQVENNKPKTRLKFI